MSYNELNPEVRLKPDVRCFKGGGMPPVPPPQPPPPPPPPPARKDAARLVSSVIGNERRKKGRGSTILTRPGAKGYFKDNVERKTLLGE